MTLIGDDRQAVGKHAWSKDRRHQGTVANLAISSRQSEERRPEVGS